MDSILFDKTQCIEIIQSTLFREARAINDLAARVDETIVDAVQLILNHSGKIIVSGIGKSGHIAQKITATFCSTGTPAVYLHPSEALHGDLGIYAPGDPTVLISKSGSTHELLRLIPILRSLKSKIIAIVSNLDSPLARQVDIVLNACIKREADPLGLAPTASTMAAMAIGDALASGLMFARRFTEEDFAGFHPGGQLGRNLLLNVSDVMHPEHKVAKISPQTPFKNVIVAMTEFNLGAACVIDENRRLLGLITDGDLRRILLKYDDIRTLRAGEIMTQSPITIPPDAPLKDALQLMEDRPSQISVLPVVDPLANRWLGLVRVHDIYQPILV